MKLAPEDDFVLRVVQLSELLASRHCVFLMGPPGCGRTECYRVRRGGGGRFWAILIPQSPGMYISNNIAHATGTRPLPAAPCMVQKPSRHALADVSMCLHNAGLHPCR
jgi:hypothetical protein